MCAFGELVVDTWRDLAVPLAREHPVGDHPVQARAQLLGRDPGQYPLELDEPARTGGKVADDQQRPLVADEIERPSVGRPLVVGMTFWRRYVGNGISRWTVLQPASSLTNEGARNLARLPAIRLDRRWFRRPSERPVKPPRWRFTARRVATSGRAKLGVQPAILFTC